MLTDNSSQPLLTSVRMGSLELRNRIAMAPLTRMRANNPGRTPTALHADYYAQRASAGLIIGECTEISPDAYGWADTPGLWSREQVSKWRTVTEAVHGKGGLYNVDMTFERANRLIKEGLVDSVAFGRSYIANPDLVERFRIGAPLAEIDWSTVYASGPRGYTDYPIRDGGNSEVSERDLIESFTALPGSRALTRDDFRKVNSK